MKQLASTYKKSFYQMIRQITEDYMLFAAMLAPIFAGLLIRFGVPFLEGLLSRYFDREQLLMPYYPMFDLLLAMVAPLMLGFISALIMLEERDDRISSYLVVTPLGKRGYLISRLVIPAFFSSLVSFIILLLCRISAHSFIDMLILSVYAGILGIITCLFIISLSSNKVEGMALGKLSGLLLIVIFLPFLIPGNLQYVGIILPSFYLGKYVVTKDWIWLILGVGCIIAWCVASARKFIKRTFY